LAVRGQNATNQKDAAEAYHALAAVPRGHS
jgi:hypothetical protein